MGKTIRDNVSPYRWVILFATIPVIASVEMVWLTFSPIASIAADYYGVSGFAIDMLATSYFLMFIVFCVPASYVIDKFGFRKSLLIGAMLTGVFSLTRAVWGDSFTVVIISQFLIAAGQPFLLNITTKAAANWFPFEERSTADGLLTMAQYLGMAVAMVLSPMLTESMGMKGILFVISVICLISMGLVIFLVKEAPAVPPPGPVAEKTDFTLKQYIDVFRNRQFVIALILAFVSIGIFNTILTLIESIMGPRGITADQVGVIGAAFLVAGIIGSIIIPIISDKAGKRKIFILVVICIIVPLYLGLSVIADYTALLIVAAAAGFLIMGVAPILFQHSTEVAYPAKEGTSLGLMLLMGQISGTIFVMGFSALSGSIGITVPMIIMVILTALEIPLILMMKESSLVKSTDEQ